MQSNVLYFDPKNRSRSRPFVQFSSFYEFTAFIGYTIKLSEFFDSKNQSYFFSLRLISISFFFVNFMNLII